MFAKLRQRLRKRPVLDRIDPLRAGEQVYRRNAFGDTEGGTVYSHLDGVLLVTPTQRDYVQVWDDRETQRVGSDVVDTYL